MKLLEDKIRESAFKNEVPPLGHQERFEQRLNSNFGKSRSLKWHLTAYAAAIILLISTIAVIISNNDAVDSQLILSLENDEFVESEVYFQNIVAQKIAIIESLDSTNTNIIEDLNEFDESLMNLKKDLYEAPGDERIVQAVLNTYMLKIEALDNLVVILKKIS